MDCRHDRCRSKKPTVITQGVLSEHSRVFKKRVTVTATELQPADRGYKKVVEKFLRNRKNCCLDTITRIFRLKNTEVRDRYWKKRRDMMRDNGGVRVKEEQLFHGTSMRNVDNICLNGLRIPRRRHCFGLAICFARRSSISGLYTDCHQTPELARLVSRLNNGHVPRNLPPDVLTQNCSHYLFLCNVLVGNSAPGRHLYRKPPPTFDSCVGKDSRHRDHLAVYDESQAYPQYLIEYGTPLLSRTLESLTSETGGRGDRGQ